VELRAPAEFGFSGTVKKHRVEDAATIRQLKSVGYTVVEQTDPAA